MTGADEKSRIRRWNERTTYLLWRRKRELADIYESPNDQLVVQSIRLTWVAPREK